MRYLTTLGGVATALCVAFLCLSVVSCATEPIQKAYQVGMVSKITATDAYKAIYKQYKAGHVSDEDMAQADELYDQWYDMQVAYIAGIEAVRAGMDRDLEALSISLGRLTDALIALAIRLEVVEYGG